MKNANNILENQQRKRKRKRKKVDKEIERKRKKKVTFWFGENFPVFSSEAGNK